jgi:hypothetical protein
MCKERNVEAATGKYDVFGKVFAELSGEYQDKLVKIAHRLLKTHQFANYETAKQAKKRKADKI